METIKIVALTCAALFGFAPIICVLISIASSEKQQKKFNANHDKWNAEFELFNKALERDDYGAADIHEARMIVINEEHKEI